MCAVFQLTEHVVQIRPGQRILRAEEYARFCTASEIIARAEEKAQAIVREAEAVYEQRRQDGYADGLAEGRREQAEKMLETGMQAVEYLEGLERDIVGVVREAIRRVIGDLPDDECIVRIVRTQLEKVRSHQQVTIRVSVQEEEPVRRALAGLLGPDQDQLRLVADPRMEKGACTLESEMGVIDASLSVQLSAIERALQARIGEEHGL